METKYPSQFWNQINDPLPLPGWGYISRTRVRTTRPPCCPRHPVFRYAALNFEPLVERTCRIGRMPLICRFINQRTATAPGRFNLPNQTPNFTIQIDQQTSTPDHDDTRTNPVFHRLLIGQKKSDTHLSCFPAPYEGSGAGLAKPHTDIVVKTKPLHPNPNTKHWEFLGRKRTWNLTLCVRRVDALRSGGSKSQDRYCLLPAWPMLPCHMKRDLRVSINFNRPFFAKGLSPFEPGDGCGWKDFGRLLLLRTHPLLLKIAIHHVCVRWLWFLMCFSVVDRSTRFIRQELWQQLSRKVVF